MVGVHPNTPLAARRKCGQENLRVALLDALDVVGQRVSDSTAVNSIETPSARLIVSAYPMTYSFHSGGSSMY